MGNVSFEVAVVEYCTIKIGYNQSERMAHHCGCVFGIKILDCPIMIGNHLFKINERNQCVGSK